MNIQKLYHHVKICTAQFIAFCCVLLFAGIPIFCQTGNSQNTAITGGKQKILIAYFTWADNTRVTDTAAAVQSALQHYEAMGDASRYTETDAVSSASVVPPGNTAIVAQFIQEAVGGDLFSIQTAEPYPENYNDCLNRASEEKARNIRPVLANHVENMEDYDIVFLGYPNWWYSVPMAVLTFAETYDFRGLLTPEQILSQTRLAYTVQIPAAAARK